LTWIRRKERLMSEAESGERYEREELLPFPIDDVWSAISEPDGLAAWLGGRVVADPRPGGELEVESVEGEPARTGFFEEVDALERRLSLWWACPDEESSRVEIELWEVDDEATRVVIVESRPLVALDAGGTLIETWAGASGPQMSASPLVAA
jgi:uncharacterized protein YndB with AHSA1/START domain